MSQGRIVPHDVLDGGAVSPGTRLRGVGEGQARGVDDAVVPHQGDGNLGGLPDPLPAAAELGDVGHDAQHVLLTPVHGLGLHVAKPH